MNFLVIGGGSIGKRHIKNLKALGHPNVFCLRRKSDDAFDAETGARTVTSIGQLESTIDAVIICTPTSLHNEGLKIAVELCAGVFMEKPLIHSSRGLKEAISLIAQLHRPFFIGFMLRYHPLVKLLKSLLEGEVVGPIYSARFEFGSYLPYWHPWEDYRTSYASRREFGGGVINTITHELDLIQFFFGSPMEVTCSSANFNRLQIDVEEMAEATLRYSDKLVTLHLDYLQKDYNRSIKLLGENGRIEWNWHEQKIRVLKHKLPAFEHILDKSFDLNQLYVDEMNHFTKILLTPDIPNLLDSFHAIENTRITLALHKAAERRQSIDTAPS